MASELEKQINRQEFWRKARWILSVGMVIGGMVLVYLLMTGCFLFGTPDPANDKDKNGIDDGEDSAWQWGELLATFIPGAGGLVAGGIATAYKWRQASAATNALKVVTGHVEEATNMMPAPEREKFARDMADKQELAGVREIVQKARGKPIKKLIMEATPKPSATVTASTSNGTTIGNAE